VQYVQMIGDGFVKPGGDFELVRDTPVFAVADAHFNLGQVAATKALGLAFDKAKQHGIATCMIRNCNHVGRLGSYTHRAALAGFASLMSVNSPGPGGVAPFGGIERKLGTSSKSNRAIRPLRSTCCRSTSTTGLRSRTQMKRNCTTAQCRVHSG